MDVINNCTELLTHLFQNYGDLKYACGGYIMFQGNVCEVEGIMPGRWCILMPSTKFPRTVFAIDDNDELPLKDYVEDGQFILYIFKGDAFVLDQTLAVKLPNYIKDELIATIQGYQ